MRRSISWETACKIAEDIRDRAAADLKASWEAEAKAMQCSECEQLKQEIETLREAGKVLVEANTRHFDTATQNARRLEDAQRRITELEAEVKRWRRIRTPTHGPCCTCQKWP